jgi:dephospho-CoA kinase
LIALNAALLYQMGLESRCDLVLYVRAPAGIRLDRIVTHRGLPVERARLRLMAQDPEPQGDARVVFFDNDGSLAGMRQWVTEQLVPRLSPDWHSPSG